MKAYQGVMHFIRRFEKKYNRYVIVKDYSGYMEQDADLSKVFSNHFIHDSSFCMKIKEEEQNWNKCYDQKRKIYNKLSHTHEGFCGHCHAGVKEYVYPLYYYDDTEDVLIGSINNSKVFGDYVGMPPTAYRKSVVTPESKVHDNRRNK